MCKNIYKTEKIKSKSTFFSKCTFINTFSRCSVQSNTRLYTQKKRPNHYFWLTHFLLTNFISPYIMVWCKTHQKNRVFYKQYQLFINIRKEE